MKLVYKAMLTLAFAGLANQHADAAKVLSYPAQPVGSIAAGDWYGYGSVLFHPVTNKPTVIGDYIGYDFSDVDGDGNISTTFFNSPFFYDTEYLLAKHAGTSNVTLAWEGCLAGTSLSYHWTALGQPNPLFTGAPSSFQGPLYGVDIALLTRWELPGRLLVYRGVTSEETTPIDLSIASPNANGDFCGSFVLKRVGSTVEAYFNNSLVFSGPSLYPSGTPLMAYSQTFDRPSTIDDLSYVIEEETDTPPDFTSLSPSQSTIWPPNGKMTPITLSAVATDEDGPVNFTILDVSIVDGTSPVSPTTYLSDVEITGPLSLKLRAKRSGSGSGRIYTITVRATDSSGNYADLATTVTVPHNK